MSKKKNNDETPPQTHAEGMENRPTQAESGELKGGSGGATGYYQSASTPTGPSGATGYYQSPSTPTGAAGGGGYYTNSGYGGGGVSQSSSTVAEGTGAGKKQSKGGKVSQGSATVAEGLSQAEKDANIKALVGRTIDRYRIIKLLGEGGFGAVYKAEHTLMKRDVAFKTLHKELAKDPAVLHRFKKEGQVAARFKHKNCIELYDFGQMDDGTFFMAMEFLPGKDLRDIVKKRGALEVPETFDIMIQTLAGLQAAHDGGVIHRDLKPDNIKLEEREGRTDFVKILDFGIAKIKELESKLDEQTGKSLSAGEAENMLDEMGEIDASEVVSDYKTQVGAFFGTPEYGSPEQCAGEEIDARSDLYTMGVILYEILTGSLPFVSKTPQGYLAQHMVAPPRPISEIRPDLKIPPEVEGIIMKALEKRREDRFQSATEFMQALIDCAQDLGIPITAEGGGAVIIKTPTWKLVTYIGVPVTVLSSALAFFIWNQEDPQWTGALAAIDKVRGERQYVTLIHEIERFQADEGVTKKKDERLKLLAEKLAEAKKLRDAVLAKVDGVFEDVKRTYDDLKVEDRVYEPTIAKLRGAEGDPDVAAWKDQKDRLEAKAKEIEEQREADALAAFKKLEPDVVKLYTEDLEFDKAREKLTEFPRKFQPVQSVQDRLADARTKIKTAEDTTGKADKQALAELRIVDDYKAKNPADYEGQVQRYQKFVSDFPNTRSQKVVNDTRLPEVRKAWEAAATAFLAPIEARLAEAKLAPEAAKLVGLMKDLEAYPKSLEGASEGAAKRIALQKDVTDTAVQRFREVTAEVRDLRERFLPKDARDLVQPWTTIYFAAKEVASEAAVAVASLDKVLPLHEANLAMVLVPTSDKVVVGEKSKTLPSGPFQPARRVEGFWVDVTEVTNRQYYEFLHDPWRQKTYPESRDIVSGQGRLPAEWDEGTETYPSGLDEHPVRGVSLRQAKEFARWASKRVPTEVEWEYAARGPGTELVLESGERIRMEYPWGTAPSNPALWPAFANIKAELPPRPPTTTVRNYENGKSKPFKLFDMAGNVAEWTTSPYLIYEGSSAVDPDFGPNRFVVRGGSFAFCNGELKPARVAARNNYPSDARPGDVGFRCVKPEKPPGRGEKR